MQGAEASQLLCQQIHRALAQAKSKLQGKIASFSEQLRGGETAAATQKLADMLMANVHRCKLVSRKMPDKLMMHPDCCKTSSIGYHRSASCQLLLLQM